MREEERLTGIGISKLYRIPSVTDAEDTGTSLGNVPLREKGKGRGDQKGKGKGFGPKGDGKGQVKGGYKGFKGNGKGSPKGGEFQGSVEF